MRYLRAITGPGKYGCASRLGRVCRLAGWESPGNAFEPKVTLGPCVPASHSGITIDRTYTCTLRPRSSAIFLSSSKTDFLTVCVQAIPLLFDTFSRDEFSPSGLI